MLKRFTILFLLAVMGISTHVAAESLEHTKLAAEGGDATAQDKLADGFLTRGDRTQAELWYRKAAMQGCIHAQVQLGNLLLQKNDRAGASTEMKDGIEEALQWLTIAANQGDKETQKGLAGIYLEGRLVPQDLVEAYKWSELASQTVTTNGVVISGSSSVRDEAILKMDADQIAAGRGRVSAFVPHKPLPGELPKPAWVQQIRLNGIAGNAGRRFATIGKDTYTKGEGGSLKINGKPVAIHCLDITDSTVVLVVEGVSGTVTLALR